MKKQSAQFVRWFRDAAPYIHAFRGRTFVLAFGGEVLSDGQFMSLAHDLNLLNSLGVKLVLVYGMRPQVEQKLRLQAVPISYAAGLRVTDEKALECVIEVSGRLRAEIEATLSMGLADSPMHNAGLRVSSGNFIVARPAGIRDGVDLQHTGEVRRVDAAAIRSRLDFGDLVVVSPLGYSPTGEVFNLAVEEVAAQVAISLAADKLIFLMDAQGALDDRNELIRSFTVKEGLAWLQRTKQADEDMQLFFPHAVQALRKGVHRTHFIDRNQDGAILHELFTLDGCGTMLTIDSIDSLRPAQIEDVPAILALVNPLAEQGSLVRRTPEQVEQDIRHFTVVEHDGLLIGCAAFYPFLKESFAEMACLAVHPHYRAGQWGELLLDHVISLAKEQGIKNLFVLTTRTAHWFIEHGFVESEVSRLPKSRQELYNSQRRSKVLIRFLGECRV
ncbi:MAG: amino-acid N-acetyltransferase [Proteobacteria bacterium]|nr:amino-acid N-acetyltransferase [Pseudomonadota bacterium]MDE3207722.1 amino-acid N-acetyltransferase [Pseudomonadota bacterium]